MSNLLQSQKTVLNQPYVLGLDIGIASVGWALLGENHIIDLGVRCFDKAEIPSGKEAGKPQNYNRRMKRLARHRLWHRRARLNQVAKALQAEGLIDNAKTLMSIQPKGTKQINLWQLRVEALTRKLTAEEWARVIYHICKHRGFHWASKAEEATAEGEAKSESGQVKVALAQTKKMMEGFATAAQMVLTKFPQAQRNKGNYEKSLSRVLLADELKTLFEKQRALGNAHADEKLQTLILGNGDKKSGLLWQQKQALSGEALLKMLGKCTFEKTEYRAAKNSYLAERHMWMTRLNNLRLVVNGKHRALTEVERQAVINLPYNYSDGMVTYEQIAKKLISEKLLTKDGFRFAGLRYPSANDDKAKNPEKDKLVQLKGWAGIAKAYKEAGLIDKDKTENLVSQGLVGDFSLLDKIAWALSINKTDEEKEMGLISLNLPHSEKIIPELLKIAFKEFSNLSLLALSKIVPEMEKGLRYDEACINAGYHHSMINNNCEKSKYLPSLYQGRDKNGRMVFNDSLDESLYIPRNPVVLRAINQARRVINAIIQKYGAPMQINIEMARDLSRPNDERRKIENEQKAYQEKNEESKKRFIELFHKEPIGKELLKFQLYSEQQGKCAYSLQAIDLTRLLENGYVEIDHIIPFSRSYDDSKNNKVLVHTKQNQDKGNRTPYEYLGGAQNSKAWQEFSLYVQNAQHYRGAKKNRLLNQHFGQEDSQKFLERNINDTRYICRFMKNYIENYLALNNTNTAERCVVLSGQLTSLLRARWGLIKVREASDRHHALDAAVIAACSRGMVQRMANYSKRKELAYIRDDYVDETTGEIVNKAMLDKMEKEFPKPWALFHEELMTRLNEDNPETLRNQLQKLGSYSGKDLQNVKPLFVSRSPQKNSVGALHKESIFNIKNKTYNKKAIVGQGEAIQKKPLENLSDKDWENLENIVVCGKEPINKGLIISLKKWYESKAEREKQVRVIEEKLGRGNARREPTEQERTLLDSLNGYPRKPLKGELETGIFTGPIIKKIKVIKTQNSGVMVQNGLAELGEVFYTEIYRRENGEYVFRPRYEISEKKIIGLSDVPKDIKSEPIKIFNNSLVKIENPTLTQIYKIIRKWKDNYGNQLYEINKIFTNNCFIGYWCYFEPSNDRPVLQLHDSSSFFIADGGIIIQENTLTIIETKEKNTKGKETIKYYPFAEDAEKISFSITGVIKRKIIDSKKIELLHVSSLGEFKS